MSKPNIRSVGAYTPAFRIEAEEFVEAWGRFEARGIDSTAVPDADEDALTMAAGACRRALDAAGIDGAVIDWLGFATTTPPLAEEELTPRLASMLGVSERAQLRTFTGSTRAGVQSILAAPTTQTALVVAADCPRGAPDDAREHAAGAGAAAFVLDPDGPGKIVEHGEHASPYPGTRFRRTGREAIEGVDVARYERQAFTETLSNAAKTVDTNGVTATAVQAPDGKRPYRAATALGVEQATIRDCATVHELGDTGAASVPLSLARALRVETGKQAHVVLAAAFGSGAGATVLRIELDGTIPSDCALTGDRNIRYSTYLRRRGEITSPGIETGAAYVSVPSWQRSLPQRHRLVAGRCPDCEALTFPPDGACSGCRALVDYEPIELWGSGTVETVTAIERGGAPPEFAAQQARAGAFSVAIVRFEHGSETVSLPSQLIDTAAVGDRVTPAIRHIYTQEGVPRYGVKFITETR